MVVTWLLGPGMAADDSQLCCSRWTTWIWWPRMPTTKATWTSAGEFRPWALASLQGVWRLIPITMGDFTPITMVVTIQMDSVEFSSIDSRCQQPQVVWPIPVSWIVIPISACEVDFFYEFVWPASQPPVSDMTTHQYKQHKYKQYTVTDKLNTKLQELAESPVLVEWYKPVETQLIVKQYIAILPFRK